MCACVCMCMSECACVCVCMCVYVCITNETNLSGIAGSTPSSFWQLPLGGYGSICGVSIQIKVPP